MASEDPTRAEKGFVVSAAILVVGALAANEWLLARFSSDGSLEASTVGLIRWAQLATLALAALLFLGRHRLVRLFERDEPALTVLLWLGIALRVVVFAVLGPDNNDPHREVLEWVVQHGWTPTAEQATLGFHPPLYYLIAAPWALGGDLKRAQILSLLLSIANLVVLQRLLRSSALLRDPRARVHAFLLLALLPQFVIFGMFVSNDALAFPLGSLLFAQWMLYVDRPTLGRLVGVGVGLGLGLLTKGTFTAFVPAGFAVVLTVGLRRRLGLAAHARALALLTVTTVGLGCYKFVENTVLFGTPVVSNDELEQAWLVRQQGTVQGLSSFVDVDLPRLIRHPFVGEETSHSLPLLFYGTFWYSYIHESNLDRTRRHPYTIVPRAVYAAGALPTLLMLWGFLVWLARNARPWKSLRASPEVFRRRLLETAFVVTLLFNFATVLSWGLKHDAWSFFQSRLAFSAIFAVGLLLGIGFESLAGRFPRTAALVNVALLAPWAASLAWLAVEALG